MSPLALESGPYGATPSPSLIFQHQYDLGGGGYSQKRFACAISRGAVDDNDPPCLAVIRTARTPFRCLPGASADITTPACLEQMELRLAIPTKGLSEHLVEIQSVDESEFHGSTASRVGPLFQEPESQPNAEPLPPLGLNHFGPL
jgi:hypothetical protein